MEEDGDLTHLFPNKNVLCFIYKNIFEVFFMNNVELLSCFPETIRLEILDCLKVHTFCFVSFDKSGVSKVYKGCCPTFLIPRMTLLIKFYNTDFYSIQEIESFYND